MYHRAADGSASSSWGRAHPSASGGRSSGNARHRPGLPATQAKFLAKHGVNLVRYLDRLPACDPANINAVNASVIDNAQRIVAAFKQAGIYTELDYYCRPFHPPRRPGACQVTPTTWPALGRPDVRRHLKAAYKQWVTQMFTATNPYTGIPLAQDPALAVIEIQNEDSFLCWTFDPNDLPRPQLQNLETKFGALPYRQVRQPCRRSADWGQGSRFRRRPGQRTDGAGRPS